MADEYRFNKHVGNPGARSGKGGVFRNKIIFAIVATMIVMSAGYFLFLVKEQYDYWTTTRMYPNNTLANNTTIIENNTCGDDCLVALAISSGNSSYCLNVSRTSGDECWRMFSNDEINACLRINEYSLKKSCISYFATTSKNLSLCNLLSGADAANCIDEISPPCMDVNGTAREVCLAMRYNNTKYCSNEACLLEFAKASRDSSVCSGIKNEAENGACRSLVDNKDYCHLFLGSYTKDYCYQLMAQNLHDFSYCRKTTTPLYEYNCYLSAAIELKKPEYCKNTDIEYIWDCYKNYSLALHDMNGCISIDNYASNSKDGCFYEYAKKFEEPNACNYLSTIYMKTNCYADLIIGGTELTVAKCNAVQNPTWKDKCFSRAAYLQKDVSICSKIAGDDERKNCETNTPAPPQIVN